MTKQDPDCRGGAHGDFVRMQQQAAQRGPEPKHRRPRRRWLRWTLALLLLGVAVAAGLVALETVAG